MLTGQINFEGKTLTDVERAIQEALNRINQGTKWGFDENDSGSFNYRVRGEEDFNKTFRVELNYQSTAGNPCSVRYEIEAKDEDGATDMAVKRLKKRKNFMKLYEGTTEEI